MFKSFFNKRRIAKGVEIEDSVMTVTQKEKAMIEVPFNKKGLSFFWGIIVFGLVVLIGRAFYLTSIKGDYYLEISKGNRVRNIVMKAPRGLILDKHGKILANNIPSIDAVVVPGNLPKEEAERKAMAKKLAGILDMEEGNIEILLANQNFKSFNPVLLKENIDQEESLILTEKTNEFPGVELERTAIRSYENGAIFSQFIGYDGKITQKELAKHKDYLMTDYIGKVGLEKEYEAKIKGTHGAKQVEVDSLGNAKRTIGVINPTPGSDLILNIDEDLQKKLFDSLTAILEETGTNTAAAVAIDPRNGGVLAMVSLPSYDNNLFARGISNEDYQRIIQDENLPLLNRAIAGEYPPGSTIKPAVAVAGLSEAVITPETTVNDSQGAIHVGAWRFGDWKTHGIMDVKKAIAESCDVFFYAVGGGWGNISGLGMDRMKKYENMFGFGNFTGIDISGEADGLIPNEKWKEDVIGERWYIGDSYHSSIGQGFITVTPLQLANYTASIANGGSLYSPRLVNRIKKNDGNEEIVEAKILNSNFVSSEVLKTVREGMRMTVTDGTAQSLKSLPVEAAGKTGTAEFGIEKGSSHAWFISFAPYDNPEIAMAIIVPGGGEGHSSAVPVTKDVLEWYFSRKEN